MIMRHGSFMTETISSSTFDLSKHLATGHFSGIGNGQMDHGQGLTNETLLDNNG